jgi:autotransporter-like protein
MCAISILAAGSSLAQTVSDADLQNRANAVLTLLGFAVTPDVTTGSLSISDQGAGNPYFRQTSISGGGTLTGQRLYLEGTLAYGRYDPTFAETEGGVTQSIQVNWDSVLVTGGIGWDFPLARNLVIRPIFNLSLGRVESESNGALPSAGSRTLEFLRHGHLNAAGVGGSVMLDYERYGPESEVDAELRYSNIHLQSFQSSSACRANRSRRAPRSGRAIAHRPGGSRSSGPCATCSSTPTRAFSATSTLRWASPM